LSFGARGNLVFQLATFGPTFALHSGHYGNWANPAWDLTKLMASMKDANGRVLVNGFYDDVPPLSPAERRILAAVPDRPDDLMRFFGIGRTEQSIVVFGPDSGDRQLQISASFPIFRSHFTGTFSFRVLLISVDS
jgi:hypothetical protein